jgi:hypothetical protein
MSTSKKQAFLRKNIVAKNCDTDRFIKFLEDFEDKDTDLDNWTMEELSTAVNKYHEDSDSDSVSSQSSGAENQLFGKGWKTRPTEEEESSGSESSDSSSDEEEEKPSLDVMDELTGGVDIESEEQIEINEAPVEKIEAFKVVGEKSREADTKAEPETKKKFKVRKSCPTLEKTVLVDCKNLKFNISKPSIVKAGFFKQSFTVYTIKTSPFDWAVTRRYSDFDWLYNCLVKRFSSHFVSKPPVKYPNLPRSHSSLLRL